MSNLQYFTYATVFIAFIAMFAKAFRYLKAPAHFRWELYPVPHEKGRAEYGGSYLEEPDWWSKPRRTDLLQEIREMMAEIFLLKGVFHHNRRVWTFSLPFHFGLYLCIGWLSLLLPGSLLQMSGVEISANSAFIGLVIHYATIIFGYAGLILSVIGALGLLQWRLSDSEQRRFNSPADYFNLILFVIVAAVALVSHLRLDTDFAILRNYVQSLITFSPFTLPGAMFQAEIALISLLIMYIPLTRMSHFVAKYFLYHSVRWNDKPNERGSKIEKNILELLKQKVDWQAPHIQTGNPWTEVVREPPNE
ncbi:MAG TPA: nitrate reductase [Bacteroidetes bacterium]|nr:nitrate reductase [Bacteroidota bacterium]